MSPEGRATSSQARKLGLKPGQRYDLDGAPEGWRFDDPPVGTERAGPSDRADLVVGFFGAAHELAERLPRLVRRIFPAGALWIAWPRRAAGHSSDITDNVVREHALPLGVVDVKVAAIDEDWSGLKMVWRVELRELDPGVAAPPGRRS
jgi:hypothetical protein